MKERRHTPLRLLLILPFALQTMGVVGVVGYFSFRNGQAAVQRMTGQLQEAATDRVEQHLDAFFSQPTAAVEANATAVMLGQLRLEDDRILRQYLLKQLNIFPHVDGLYWGDETGKFLCVCGSPTGEPVEKVVTQFPSRSIYEIDGAGDRQALLSEDTYDPRQRPWYQNTEQHQALNWSSIYPFTDGSLGITASAPIFDQLNSGEQLLGVAGADLRLAHLGEFVREIATTISPNSQVFIVERSGLLVATSLDESVVEEETSEQAGAPKKKTRKSAIAHPQIRGTAQAIQNQFGNFEKIQQAQRFSYPAQASSDSPAGEVPESDTAPSAVQNTTHSWSNPLHQRQFVQVLPYQDARGLDWLIVVAVPEADFMGDIRANVRATIQLCILALGGSILLSMVIAHVLAAPIHRISQAAHAISSGDLQQTVGGGHTQEVELLARSFNTMVLSLRRSFTALEDANSTLEERVLERTAALEKETDKADRLLLNILPRKIAEQLKQKQQPIAQSFDSVSILFADIVGFTPLSSQNSATYMVNLLNQLFCQFDDLVELHQLEKIKTIGDAYMVAAGLPEERGDHGDAIASFALDMLWVFQQFAQHSDLELDIRIGINSGSAVGGVIGHKKFIYDLWGDAVNVAARMESSSEPNRIQMTAATRLQLQKHRVEKRGEILIKGKGKMTTYWLLGEDGSWPGSKLQERSKLQKYSQASMPLSRRQSLV